MSLAELKNNILALPEAERHDLAVWLRCSEKSSRDARLFEHIDLALLLETDLLKLNPEQFRASSDPEKNKVLLALFQEQWTQIRHLDGLDFRTMSVLPIAVSVLAAGLGLMEKEGKPIPDGVLCFICLTIVGLSLSGCYTTCRNWLCYMRRLSILSAVEEKLELVKDGIIGKNFRFNAPTDFYKYHRSFFKSIRFPLTVFYCLLAGAGLVLFQMEITFFNIAGGIGLAVAVFAYCDLTTFLSFRKEFENN